MLTPIVMAVPLETSVITPSSLSQTQLLIIGLIVGVWELVWKGIALWKSARSYQKNWFIAILVFNTLGLLPIIYLKFFQRRKRTSKKPKNLLKKLK